MRKSPYSTLVGAKQGAVVTDLTGGINILKDPLYIADKESPNIICGRYDKGILKKDMGWTAFGLPLLGVPMYIDTYYKSDGVYRVLCFTTTSAYKYDSTIGDWYDITRGVELTDCETAWTASASITATADGTYYKKGTYSAKLAIAAGFTTGLAAYYDISSKDLTTHDHIHLWVRSSVALAAGDIQLLLDNTSGCVSPVETIDFPAIVADTWTRVSLTIATPASCGAIVSVGLNVAVDKGACNIYLDDIRSVIEYTGTVLDPFSATTYLDTYVVTNFKDPILKYDASPDYLELLGGSPPRAKSITTFTNRLVVCFTNDGSDHPFRVQWSDAGTIETWTPSNYLEASDGFDWCTSLNTLGNKCVLFKEVSIWDLLYIGGTSVFQLNKKIDQVSCMAPSTIQRVRDKLVFFGYDGIYSYDQSQVQCISDNIYPILFKTGEKTVNLGAVQAFNASYIEELREYWVSLCENSSSTPSLLMKYNITESSFIRRNDKPITCIGYYEKVTAPITWATATGTWGDASGAWGSRSLPGNAATTLVGYNDGQIYEDDRFTTTSDEFIFETKDFLYAHATRLTECRVEARYGGFTIWYSVDGGVTWTEGTTFAFRADWSEFIYYMNITTQVIRFKLTTSQPTFELRWIEPWHIDRFRSKTLRSA